MAVSSTTAQVRLKTVAIPPEHGAWGFLLEPVALGMLVAPSPAGICLALAVLGAFLMRHPLKIAVTDRQRGKRYERTALAERVALGYGALALGGGLAAVLLAGVSILLPFMLAAPLSILMFASYAQNRGRDLLPELAGAVALAATASGVALAGDEPLDRALALWAILAARDVPSILYIRARLRLERGKPHSVPLVAAANAVGVAGILALALAGFAPALAVIALVILFGRAMYGLSPYRRAVRVQIIGVLEMFYGLLVVALTAIGYAL